MAAVPGALFLVLTIAAHLASGKKLRWCTLSDQEQRKCSELSKALLSVSPPVASGASMRVSCIRAPNTFGCIDKIRVNKADAVSLDAGEVYSAVKLYGLTVVAKEIYLEVISSYFNASCIPGIGTAYPKLCALCQGQKSYIWEKNHFCETSNSEPFYGSEGAFRCLKLGWADVAFLDHLTVMNATEREAAAFELLCPDGSTAPLMAYTTCHLGRGPGRAVVTRPNFQKVTRDLISVIQRLFGRKGRETGRFELFASASFRGRDLLFPDATQQLQLLGKEAEIGHILGLDYVALLQGLGHEGSTLSSRLVRWCCISDLELRKCEEWALSVSSDPLVCVQADSMSRCIELIKKDKADAVTLDATHAYFAEACALVPVAAECYGDECAPKREGPEKGTHLAGLPPLYLIALARKTSRHVNRHALRGKRSCHSHVYSPGGWLLLSQHTVGAKSPCNLSSAYEDFFWKGCMPGAGGNLCKVCIGQEEGGKVASRCAANHNELYYGNLGALRCLLGDPTGRSVGDVAFLEHHNLLQNLEYLGGSGWAAGYGPRDFELLCPNGSRAAITAWKDCNLGHVPPNIMVTRPATSTKVYNLLAKSQESSNHSRFQLFQSLQFGGSDLLFKDATRRLFFTSRLDFKSVLGEPFFQLAQSVFNCTPAGILDFCQQDSCTPPLRQP